MNNIYKKKYNKYKNKYLNLKGKCDIHLDATIGQTNIDELQSGLKHQFNVQIINEIPATRLRGVFITNTLDLCEKSKSKFDKIILLANEKNANQLEFCSITCTSIRDIIHYLLMDDYNLELTYLFDGNSGMRKLTLHQKLRSWTIKYGTPSFVDYLNQGPNSNGRLSKELYSTHTVLHNVVDIDTISHVTDKQKLYTSMRNQYDDYTTFMPTTRDLETIDTLGSNQVLIVKPVGPGAHSGWGISIVTNNAELDIAKKFALANKKWKWIASEYIINPLLFNGIKFHLRSYLMVTTRNKFYHFSMSEMLLAGSKYKPSDFSNKAIHDSHSASTLQGYFYPGIIDDARIGVGISKIMDKLIGVFTSASHPKIAPYATDKYGYDILGVDILFDSNYNPWLLEVNTKVGHGAAYPHSQYKNFEKTFLIWEYSSIVRPIFSKIDLMEFTLVSDKMISQLLQLTTNYAIMHNIGRGELWNRTKIAEMISQEKNDTIDTAAKQYYSWVVKLRYGGQKVVGYVSLRPMFKNGPWKIGSKDLQIRIFTYPSQGYGTSIMKKIIKFASSLGITLWAVIHPDNDVSVNFFKKLGWKSMGEIKLTGKDNLVFSTCYRE